ncbi:MAG TPA: hypothetical protein VJA21_15520, partial [Verrucomicrobiae bacterium]
MNLLPKPFLALSRCSRVEAVVAMAMVCATSLSTRAVDLPGNEAKRALAKWTLKTFDTALAIGVGADHRLYIYEVRSPADWNWTATASPFPLVARAEVDGSARALHWLYQKGNEEHNDGTRIILTFTNS